MNSNLPPSSRFVVSPREDGWRLDHLLAGHYPGYSRSFFLKLARQGRISVNEHLVDKAGQKLHAGDTVSFEVPPPEPAGLSPEAIPLHILFEDDYLLLVNKPPGLVAHPGSGNHSGTLAHGLLHHCPDMPGVSEGRAGLVHRLDKDTSGVLLAAKNETCLRALMTAFQERRVEKTYHAILLRTPQEESGRIVAPLGRHPVHRQKMAVRDDGRFAATRWHVSEYFAGGLCLAEIQLETGRTHQIRVHMASCLRTPVLGDAVYGGKPPAGLPFAVTRQMLHASRLRFTHPVTGEIVDCTAPFFPDMADILKQLRAQTLKSEAVDRSDR